MHLKSPAWFRDTLIWTAVVITISVPIAAAAASPLIAWRDPVYVLAGLAGVIAMAVLLVQPMLAGGILPGLSTRQGRRVHRVVGGVLTALVVIHVAALWITSPPDVVDALLFESPTPFSAWGVVAMWAVFTSALLVSLRRRLHIRPLTWRLAHTTLAAVIVVGSVVHALLIQGTMETVSKTVLCALVIVTTAIVVAKLRGWTVRAR